MTLALPRAARLTQRREIDRVFRAGKFVHGTRLVVGCVGNGGGPTRAAVVVARARCGGSVQRNRVRRVLRELFRLTRPRLAPGFDLVILPRTPRTRDDYRVWENEWQTLARKAGVLLPDGEARA